MSKRRSPPSEVRAYDTSLRHQLAGESRERVIEVSTRLFAERGFAETTVAAIAGDAGVSVATVYAAFGSKRGILSGLLDRLVSGDSSEPQVLKTDRARAVFAEPDPRQALRIFAAHIVEVQDRVGPIFEAMRHAARTDDEIHGLYVRAQNDRFRNLEKLVGQLAERGGLREGLSVEDAARTLWVLASPETRERLATLAGWTAGRYADWLASTLVAALLRPPPNRA